MQAPINRNIVHPPVLPCGQLMLQRKASCACGGSCPRCQAKSHNLKISQPDDLAEIQADQVAERVMRMPGGEGKPWVSTGSLADTIHRKCDPCEEDDETSERVMRNEAIVSATPVPLTGDIPQSIGSVTNSGGRPLDLQTRSFFESRFGADLSPVRIHADSAAAQSASAIDARAYTLGSHVVFDRGEYRPDSGDGRRLLAHELAHVIQQGAAASPMKIYRSCPSPAGIGNTSPGSACTQGDPLFVHGRKLKFCRDSDVLMDGQSRLVAQLLIDAMHATSITIHGNASIEGPSVEYNYNVACHRALAIVSMLRTAGITVPMGLISHGPTAVYGDAIENRNVILQVTVPTPTPTPPPAPTPTPGPTPGPTPTPTFPATPSDCTPAQARHNASGCVPNPHGSHLPDVGGTHTESHPFQPCMLTEAHVSASPDWCVDAQQAHGGEVCYREIPNVAGAPGDQYCYSANNCCHNSADAVSVVNPTSPGNGQCCAGAGAGTVLEHIWEDVVPEFRDDPCRVIRDTTGIDICAEGGGTLRDRAPDGTWYDDDGRMHMGPGPKW